MQSRRTGLSISRMRSAVNMTAPLMIETIVNSPCPNLLRSSQRQLPNPLLYLRLREQHAFQVGVHHGGLLLVGHGLERQDRTTEGPVANRYAWLAGCRPAEIPLTYPGTLLASIPVLSPVA